MPLARGSLIPVFSEQVLQKRPRVFASVLLVCQELFDRQAKPQLVFDVGHVTDFGQLGDSSSAQPFGQLGATLVG